jgi:hypothetical protein
MRKSIKAFTFERKELGEKEVQIEIIVAYATQIYIQ